MMFDTRLNTQNLHTVAAAKKLGFEEHFYGWAKRPRTWTSGAANSHVEFGYAGL